MAVEDSRAERFRAKKSRFYLEIGLHRVILGFKSGIYKGFLGLFLGVLCAERRLTAYGDSDHRLPVGWGKGS